jgi:YVTN family beta-propeller protein
LGTKRSNRIKLTPDGKFALISDLDAGDLVIVDAAGRKEVKRLAVGKAPEGVLITPDGSRAFVAVNGDNNVAVVDTKTWTIASRISPGMGPDGMAWVK